MAKLGEGDQRWIVKDREDGRNVGNWHWTEKDVSGWTRQRLDELLGGIQLVDGAIGSARTNGIDSVEGDSIINVRKGKLIATYELNVAVGFTGRAEGHAGEVTGQLSLPYISEENHDEDPEVKVLTGSDTSPAAGVVKQGILANRKVVYAAVHQFVKELRAGGPHAPGAAAGARGSSGGGGTASSAAAAASAAAPQRATGTPAPPPAAPQSSTASSKPAAKAAKRDDGGATQSLKMEEKFYARPADIFEALTDERRLRAYTQSPATSELRPGGAFSMYGGSVAGEYVEIDAPTRIVQDWRFSTWPQGATSRVEIDLQEPDAGTTILTLRQSGIPLEDKLGNRDVLESTKKGWQGMIFQKIRAVFGYGYGL